MLNGQVLLFLCRDPFLRGCKRFRVCQNRRTTLWLKFLNLELQSWPKIKTTCLSVRFLGVTILNPTALPILLSWSSFSSTLDVDSDF